MLPNHKGEIPVVLLLLPFLAGILVGLGAFHNINPTWLTCIFVVAGLAFILLNRMYGRLHLYRYRWLGGALITIVLFLSGWFSAARYSELNKSDHFSKIPARYLAVTINSEPVIKNGMVRFTAGVNAAISRRQKHSASGTLLITIKDSSANNLSYGDELMIPAKYNSVDPPFNPGEFNYKKYLAGKNIWYQAFLFPKQYVLIKRNNGNPLIAHSLGLRRQLVNKLKSNMHDTSAYAVASTLILGYKADLSEEVRQAYSGAGAIHVLSVSGAQVGIIYLLLTFSLSFLNRYKHGRVIRAVVIIAIIWFYAMLTGCSTSVCRVAVVVSMVITARAFNRYTNMLNTLAVSAFCLLLYDPFSITEAGFQLSYLAVSGIILLQPVICSWLNFKTRWLDKLWSLCAFIIAIQAAIFPVGIFYFHQFPVYFLISNLFVIIPAAAVMYTGILYLLLPAIPAISKPTAFILEKIILLMNKGLAGIAHLPSAGVNKIWITVPECLLLYGIIISLFYFLYNKKPWQIRLSLALMLLFCMSLGIKKVGLSRSNSIAWLNLKKHKGIVFKNGTEAVVLTDLKKDDKVYRYSIQPYLDSCQVNNAMIYDFNEDVNTPFFKKKGNLIQFLHDRVYIFSGQINEQPYPKVKAAYIYVTGNPHSGLAAINTAFNCRTIVVDGSNSDYSAAQIKGDADKMKVDCKMLKRNISFTSVFN